MPAAALLDVVVEQRPLQWDRDDDIAAGRHVPAMWQVPHRRDAIVVVGVPPPH
jgi:hypothetical protein